jgi:hypothetical protein
MPEDGQRNGEHLAADIPPFGAQGGAAGCPDGADDERGKLNEQEPQDARPARKPGEPIREDDLDKGEDKAHVP